MTPAEIKALYPELADVSDVAIQAQIDAFGLLYQGNYGDLSDHLLGLYVAHQVTVFTLSADTSGPKHIKSRSVDGLSWTYKDNESEAKQKAGEFGSTKYGLEFYRLTTMFGMGPTMAKPAWP